MLPLPESVFVFSNYEESAAKENEATEAQTAAKTVIKPREREVSLPRRTPVQPQSSDVPLISTIGDAMTHIIELIETQISNSVQLGAKPNDQITGDGHVKSMFYTLLPEVYQRRVFMQITRNSNSWPRLKPLFGAPPYSFLGPDDAGMLRSTGISHSRQNMTYDSNTIANYSQFGSGQFVDEFEREYRILDNNSTETDPLPCNLESRGEFVQLIVRVHKRSREEKIKRLRDNTLRKTILFPIVGELLHLTETSRLRKIQGRRLEDATRVALEVRQVKPRGYNSATAAVLATWG